MSSPPRLNLTVVDRVQQREDTRSKWLALDGWRVNGTLVGEALLDALKENA